MMRLTGDRFLVFNQVDDFSFRELRKHHPG